MTLLPAFPILLLDQCFFYMIIKQFFINELFYMTDFLRFYSGNFVSKTEPFFPGFILVGPDEGILKFGSGEIGFT